MGASLLQVYSTMFTGATKIVKPEGQEADEFEQTVAQELFNLEVRFHRYAAVSFMVQVFLPCICL